MINFIDEINHENPKDFRFCTKNPYGEGAYIYRKH